LKRAVIQLNELMEVLAVPYADALLQPFNYLAFDPPHPTSPWRYTLGEEASLFQSVNVGGE
jgi:hypothetical protein